MAFGHEKLEVSRAAIKYVGWAYLTKLDRRGSAVGEEPRESRTEGTGPESGPDEESKRQERQPGGSPDG